MKYALKEIKPPSVIPLPAFRVYVDGIEIGTVNRVTVNGAHEWRIESASFPFTSRAGSRAAAIRALLERVGK